MTPSSATTPSEPLFWGKSILFWLLALALVRGVIYASVVPPWQAPDEPAQFERVRASLSAQEWNSEFETDPAWYDELDQSLFTFKFWDFMDSGRPQQKFHSRLSDHVALYHEIYQGLYGSRPTYALMGWPLFLTPQQNIILQLYLVRLNTVLMNLGIIWLAYLMVRTIFPHDIFLAVGVPGLILFNPQHTHMLSTVNNGNLAELLTTAALYFTVRGIIGGFTWRNGIAILGFSVTAMWTKATAYFLPLALGCIALFYLWRYRRHWRWLLPAGLVLAGLFFFLAPQRLILLVPDALARFKQNEIYLDPIVPQDLFLSFWAMPGWAAFRIHPFWYQVIGWLCLLAVGGLIIGLVRRWRLLSRPELQPKIQALVVLAVAVVVAVGIILGWNALTNSIVYRQGRSLYTVLTPISLLLMLGWRQLIPPAWRKAGLLGAITLFFLFDCLVLFGYIVPIFYSRY
ncbi:MAG: hypothetical protein L6R45_03150 [Anaerolineae bacterium]|nr:hypothetical protein [Anaerolineae bacterium]